MEKPPLELFYAERIQSDVRYRTGLWTANREHDCKRVAYGPQGKMQQLCKLLNDKEVDVADEWLDLPINDDELN